MSDVPQFLEAQRARVDTWLERCLVPADALPADPGARKLHEAVRYSLLGPGKRVRPILCLVTGEILGASEAALAPAACALEMIHAYSLVHDDLPAMDDDDLRRGRPTNHVVYGEAMAILAGDALLTLAFETMARTPAPDLVGPLVGLAARAAGIDGMVAGQAADLAGEDAPADASRLTYIHRHKTAALLSASVRAGALVARAEGDARARIEQYGEALGLAFQVADDVLDVTGTPESLGKTAGKDAQAGKLTYPAVHGLTRSRAIARELADRATKAVAGLAGAGRLADLARYVVERTQ